jgi:hypothetical protein
MTILAYIIIIIVSQFTLLAGTLGTFLAKLLLFWLPSRFSNKLAPLIGCTIGPLVSLGVSWLVFTWLGKQDSWGYGALIACLLPLWIPISNDYKKAKELKKIKDEAGDLVGGYISSNEISMMHCFYGELLAACRTYS